MGSAIFSFVYFAGFFALIFYMLYMWPRLSQSPRLSRAAGPVFCHRQNREQYNAVM